MGDNNNDFLPLRVTLELNLSPCASFLVLEKASPAATGEGKSPTSKVPRWCFACSAFHRRFRLARGNELHSSATPVFLYPRRSAVEMDRALTGELFQRQLIKDGLNVSHSAVASRCWTLC